ncbi:amidase [Aestuariirhabdus sp. LZHN29]|uniref:amidase n=1 Tax=Aestuariirhabdus sp. LZHN29 TaxID=3417462 RepID=UPI003CEBA0E5
MNVFEMSAGQAAAAIREGEISSQELVQSCLDRTQALEETVGAWHYLDPEYALQQARDADLYRRSAKALGPLHGVPVGIKDIFDTSDMPTEDGTPLHAGRTPGGDATAVALLRAAGAIIMGKTVTTELAVFSPGKTRNPHDPECTPGGSSSGSAAAVAAQMVPLAMGTQTNGSIIRPASYCGVVGYKPSHGLVSRYRALQLSRVLDHVGVFGRSVADVALMAEQLMAFDDRDPDMRPRARPRLVDTTAQEPPVTPRLAFVKTPSWDKAGEEVQGAFGELTAFLGSRVEEIDLSELLESAVGWHQTIMEADLARSFRREYAGARERLSPVLRQMIERGQQCRAVDYNHAVAQLPALNKAFDEIMLEYDAILTPATTGAAPKGLESTGDPVFCTPWSLLGVPSVSAPVLQGARGLPMGAQLVASKGDDARLLRTTNWLVQHIVQATAD